MDRRSFVQLLALPAVAAGAESDAHFTVEARFYDKLPYKKIKCKLCPRECVIDDHERGYCGVRENRGGTYYSLVYARVCAAHVDPIEKKPLFHFLPGSMAFSVATAGCNVNCKMCQNWDISQSRPEQVNSTYLPPKELSSLCRQNQCPSIAYTYSEPVVFSEYVLDSAEAGRAAGVKSVVISGGYIQEEPLKQLCARVDAIKIDLKGFSEKFYKEVVNGELKPVLNTLVTIRKLGIWNEMVYLVVPTLNDSDEEFRGLARWIKTELGPDVPLHFSRFYPEYLLKNLPPTPVADAGTRQGHLRRRRSALRVYRQCSRPSGREHLVPEMPPRGGGARRLHRQGDASRQGQVPVLPTSHPGHLGRVSIAYEEVWAFGIVGVVRGGGSASGGRRLGGGGQAPKIRQPAVAGSFYPADPKELGSMIDGFLAKAAPPPLDNVVALVAPHAGYQYSGPVAAYSYALLKGRKFDRVVVIAPSHYEGFDFSSVYDGAAYATPFGQVPVDQAFAAKLAKAALDQAFRGWPYAVRGPSGAFYRGSTALPATRAGAVPAGAGDYGRSELRCLPRSRRGAGQAGPGNQHPDRGQLRPFPLSYVR